MVYSTNLKIQGDNLLDCDEIVTKTIFRYSTLLEDALDLIGCSYLNRNELEVEGELNPRFALWHKDLYPIVTKL